MMGILLTSMPATLWAWEKTDTLILNRIYSYQKEHKKDIKGLEDNIYVKCRYNVEKRNPTLWLIPSMYALARDPREYIRESYSRVTINSAHDMTINRQVLAGTVRRNRNAMSPLLNFITPNIYDIDLYDGHMLSPFNKVNHRFYRFRQRTLNDGTTRIDFRPKLYNTQLLNGYAIVETETGRIIRTILNGEFDMITFRTEIIQETDSGIPRKCNTAATFRFLGNRISAIFDANYDCQKPLPDSIQRVSSRRLMSDLRPIALTETDRQIYKAYDRQHEKDTVVVDTVSRHQRLLKKIFWDTIGENLFTPIAAENGPASFRLSPIINPLYLSYSEHHGLRYKMRLRSRYTFSPHRYLTFDPTVGYNFKQRQLYFTAPLRMTYNPKRNGYAEIVYGNGNRISNSCVQKVIDEIYQDSLIENKRDMDKFRDNHFRVFNNIMIFPWLDIESGFVYHRRSAVNKALMRQYGMPDEYCSFAPMLGVKIQLWTYGPLLSADWERGIKGINHSDLNYERWEFDASWKHHIPGLRILNLRAGGGFYTSKEKNLFVDFANFRDRNLPEGWDDDWSGDFQLLRSREYNESDYYLRGHVSYETPMLIGTWIPYLGKFIEKERLYISSVLLEKSRPYFELGYGFTNRYISVGAFASFRNTHFDRIGVEFEFELFRRW